MCFIWYPYSWVYSRNYPWGKMASFESLISFQTPGPLHSYIVMVTIVIIRILSLSCLGPMQAAGVLAALLCLGPMSGVLAALVPTTLHFANIPISLTLSKSVKLWWPAPVFFSLEGDFCGHNPCWNVDQSRKVAGHWVAKLMKFVHDLIEVCSLLFVLLNMCIHLSRPWHCITGFRTLSSWPGFLQHACMVSELREWLILRELFHCSDFWWCLPARSLQEHWCRLLASA